MAVKASKVTNLTTLTKAYAADCAHDGLYKAVPVKADWVAIMAKVCADSGYATIPYAMRKLNGSLATVWTNAYKAAERRLAKGGKLTKAAPKPKARKRTPKVQPDEPKARTYTKAEVEAAIAAAIAALA